MTDTQKPVAWVDKRQWEEFSLASWPTHLPAHNVGGDDRTGLYTADQLDAAVRAERERCARIAEGPTGSGVPCPYGNDKPGDPTWNHTDKDICPVCKKDGEGSLYACHDNIGPRIAAAIRGGE